MKKAIKKGFTLIEMIIVIAIIAILLLIIVPTMNGFISAANREKNLANARAIYVAVEAQHTAAMVGLKDSKNTAYADVTAGTTKSGCALNDDFYSGDFPTGTENACEVKLANDVYTVSCGTGTLAQTYPVPAE